MKTQRSRSTATMALATAIVGAMLVWSALAQGDATVTVSQEQLERGEKIYQETAGSVGCAYCHGVQGMGDGTAGAGAPVIAGAQLSAIRSSLAGAVPMMGFIKLSPSELEDVAAYVAYLGTLTGTDASASPPSEAPSRTEATDAGSDPSADSTEGSDPC